MKKLNELQSYLTRLRGLMLTLIILCSIGVGHVWGVDISASFACSCFEAGTAPDLFTASGGAQGSSYYTLKTGYVISNQSYNIDPTQPVSVTMKLGTYGGYKSGKNNVDFYIVNSSGDKISTTYTGTQTAKDTSGKEYTGSVTLNSGQNGQGVKFKFEAHSGATTSICARFYQFKITYTAAGGGDCSECTYYVYNGTTWEKIGTTGFTEVVLAPPTLEANGHGAGNGCWTTDKNVFTSCIGYASGEKFRYVPNPGGAAPTSVNKPGNGTCELYAVYFDEYGCLSTTVTAEPCARIWEEPDNLAVSSVSSTGATLSWDAIDGVSSYHVIVTKVSNSSIVFNGNVNGTSKSLTGLTSGTEYSWKVAANSATNDACDSNFSDGDNFTTCASGFTSLTPTVTADKTGKNGGEALFELSGATSYSVTLKNNSTNAVIAGYNNVSNTSGDITFSGLTSSTTYRVEVIAHNACGDNSQTGSETFTTDAATLYTVTFVNQSGAAVSPATQQTEGGSVTLPSASPSTACEAIGWTFAGWKDESAQEETNSAPTLIAAGSYTPSENKTFYAVFTKTEGGGGGVKTTLLSDDFSDITTGTNTATMGQTSWDGGTLWTSLTNATGADGMVKLGGKSSTGSFTAKNALSVASGTTITIRLKVKGWSDVEGQIVVSADNGAFEDQKYSYAATMSSNETEEVSSSVVLSKANPTITVATSAKRAFVDEIEIYYGGGGGGTTYWNSNPSCSSDATVTYHNDGAKSGAAPTDANSPYTIGTQVTVLGTGTMVAPDGKEFKCWNTAADGTGTDYNIGATFDIAGNMDFYPKWVNAPYTVTFDAEGGTCVTVSLTEASGGAGVTLPAATATCASAGWSFYGWATSTVSSTTIAPATFVGTTGETYYPTGDITLHAVYKEGGYAIGTGSFAQVTGTANVVDGTFYLITNVNNAGGMMYNTVTASPRIGSTTNTYASCNDINCAWQMKKNGDYWQIYSPNKNLYAAGTGVASRATLMSDGTDDKTMWTLETTGSGYYKFKNKYNTAHGVNAYLAYSDGYGYACMANNGSREVLYLYKADYGSIVAGTTTYNSNPTCETYEITIGNHTNGTVAINGTTDSPQESLAAQKITLSATPESGYRFTGWTITKTTGGNDVTSTLLGANATTASTSFTMPDYDVTVSATFAAKVMYSITWNVNGSTYATGDPSTSAESGTKWSALTLPTAPADNTLSACERTKFVGWSTSPLFGDGNSAPSDLFKTTSDANADNHTITEATTFYAVFAKGSGDFSFGWESADDASIWTISGFCSKETYNSYKKTGSYAGSIQGTSGYIQLKDKISPTSISCQYTKATSNTNNSSKFIIQTSSNGSDWTDQATGKTMNNVTQGTFYELKWTGSLNDVYVRVCYTGSNAVRVLDDVVISGGSFTDYATQCCTLKPVTNLAVSSKTANSVTLTWTAPSPTTGIDHLELRNASTDAKIGSNIAVGTTTTTVDGLTECETYTYKIVSVGAVCETPSNIVEATPFRGSEKVTFDYNGGTGTPASFTTSCGNLSTTLPAATRDGYTFLGWWTAADGGNKVGDAGANYDVATTTIHAHWAQNFTVTYDLNGGAADPICSGGTYYVGQSVTVCSTTPTKTSSSFLGWKRLDTDATVVGGSTFTMPSNNVTIQAQWETVYFHIYYKEEDGTAIATDDVPQTAETTLRNQTPCVGYTFFGWSTSKITSETTSKPAIIGKGGASYTPDADITVYPVYARSEGATTVKDTLTVANTGVTTSYTPVEGINKDKTPKTIHSNAVYAIGAYNSSGMQFTDGTTNEDQQKSSLITTTSGGSLQAIQARIPYASSTTRYLYTKGNTSDYTMQNRSSQGGTLAWTITHSTKADKWYSHDFSEDGYSSFFMYCGGGATKVDSIIVTWGTGTYYYATHCDTKENVTVTYNGNGGTVGCGSPADGAITSVTWDYKNSGADAPTLASAQTICASATRSGGYVLRDWTTGADGTGTNYIPGASITSLANDITLYAQWDRVYTVTFNDQGATTSRTQASGGSTVAVPGATTPCIKDGVTWTFAGWGTVSPLSQSLAGHIIIPSGTNTYTPTEDVTLYAVYRKELGASDAFAIGTSGAYKISAKYSNGTKTCYASTKGSGLYNCSVNAGDASTFYLNYVKSGTYAGKYTLQNSAGEYIGWSSGTTLSFSEETPAYYTVTQSGDGWLLRMDGVTGSARYFTHETSTIAYNFKAYTEANPVYFTPAAAAYYYTTMSCDDDFSITFHANGGTITWNMPLHGEGTYQHLADGTEIDVFPTATFDGWTFLGWQSANYDESTTVPEPSTIYGGSDGESGNPFTIHSNTDMYPIFTRFEDNEPFDQINGGDYYIYFLESGSNDGYGGEKRVYAATYDDKRYNSSAVCDNATTFTFTKLGNGNWTIYDNTTKMYLYGVAGDALKQQASATGAEWTLTVNGNQFDAFHVGTSYGQITAFGNGESATFMNYSRSNIGSIASYHRVYLGGCTNRTFTTYPSTTPNIEIHGQVKVTSTADKSIKAASVLTVSATNIATANLTLTSDNSAFKFSLTSNGTYTESVNIPVVSNKVGVTPIYVEYTPTLTTDGIEEATITVSDGASPTPTTATTESGDVQGRHLPTDFVIAAKIGNNWYALPADCSTSTSSTAGVLIDVDNPSDPTRATGAPMNTKYGLQPVRPGRVGDYGSRLVFTEHLSTQTTDNQKTLYNGETTSIQVYATYANYAAGQPEKYEWIPTTSDLKDYTLTSATVLDGDASARTVSLNTSGVFGTLLLAKAYDGKVRLLPATFYEPAEVQILKWKTNSVIVMYTGTDNATTKVGENAASGSQALNSHKLTQGIYEFTTNQALTANAGQTLRITLGSSRLEVEIPLIIASNTTAAADGKDVVILDGATFTAAETKRNYRNVYVYGGGKLDIPTNTSLGVNNIILRAGGVTTNGSGGSATYAYVYPQVELGGTLSSTQTNIKYEYVTDYDHWYHLCLPFNATLTSIHYPQEYYGSNVRADNSGSWIIKRYDGATRATGDYNAWKDIENDSPAKTEVTAGVGYIFWGAPKKVSVGGGDAIRQAWGIQRMTMAITSAAAATTAETNDKNISVDSYSNVNNPSNQDNDRGWNLVGNPYMVDLTAFSSDNLKQGQLVHSDAVPWDGKWKNDGTDTRYVTIPDNHFDTYEAKTTETASGAGDFMPGRVFFVQIEKGTTLTFEATNRATLAPAWHRNTEAEQPVDVETGIVMSSETLADEVNFWIKDGKTEAYEFNADYPKTPNKTSFNIYGVHQSGNLSWVAISPAIAEGDMAIGYQVPAAGDYTLSLSEKYIAEEIESVFVTDHGVSPELTTDLMVNTYTFTVHQAETNNERFTVSIKVREEDNIATDIGNSTVDTHAVKFIRDDKMYILRNGLLYDATGKRVNVINK